MNELDSPPITLPAGSSQLAFRQDINLETTYDGGVLEISIGGGAWTDILAAGGSFVTGGYNYTVSSAYNNPLAGRQAWSGISGGFITTAVNLPAAASGQTIQLRWRCGTDDNVGAPGWYIDIDLHHQQRLRVLRPRAPTWASLSPLRPILSPPDRP